MTTPFDSYPDHQLLQYDELRSRFAGGHNAYASACPFPHIVLDDFISGQLTDAILMDFPESTLASDHEIPARHSGNSGLFELSPTIRQLIWELNSSTFIRVLEGLTSLDNLIPDPAHYDAGLRQEPSGQPPLIQTVPSDDNPLGLDCRLKLELYLNRNWEDEYAGHLELWNSDLTSCVKRIRPLAGRCAIFSLNNYAYHGQSQALNCPDEVTKKLITVYYYTVGRKREALLLADIDKLAQSKLPLPQ